MREGQGEMGTTTANKHGLRKAAEENRNRHAQRTPLPPKGGVKKVEVPEYAEQYGRMTQPQLRKILKEKFGQQSANDCPKGKLLEAILRKERESRATDARAKQAAIDSATTKKVEATTRKNAKMDAALPGDSRSAGKAAQIREVMTQHGWSTILIPAEGTETAEDVWELTGKRGDEVLWISWTKGVLTTEPMPSYTIADRTIKLRNASAVKQYAERAPEVGAKELTRVANNRFFRKAPTEPKRSRLPFDTKLATNEEVLAALVGRVAAWHNRYRETEESAQVGVRGGKQPVEIRERENGERVVWFCCPETGFRAFALSQLTRVGSRKFRTRGQKNSGAYAPVEIEEG